jgi:hypothetical protein
MARGLLWVSVSEHLMTHLRAISFCAAVVLALGTAPAAAETPQHMAALGPNGGGGGGGGTASPQRPRFRTRVANGIRGFSQRTATRYRNLRDRIPPVVRHGAATALFAAVAVVSADSAMGQELISLKGMLSATGVTLGTLTTFRQGAKTLRVAFPEKMKQMRDRVRRSPVGPLLKQERPFVQRLKYLFKPDSIKE